MSNFEITGLSRTFASGSQPPIHAVRAVDLTIRAGDRVGIVGGSGSGKSTLVRMLAGLDQPSRGTITYGGRLVSGQPESRLGFLRSAVQVVFQDPWSSLNPRMRVADVVTEPLRSPLLRRRDDVPDDRAARLVEVLDAVGLPADSGRRYPHEFSGGQRQRIAIARALAPRPAVLIADEPVSALDVSVRSQVLNLLNDLVATEGLTLVLVSHDLTVVRHLCDRVVVMQDGTVVEEGLSDEVWTAPHHPYTRDLLAAVPRLP